MKGTTIKNKLSDGSEIEMTIKLRRAENRREVPEDILLEEITGAFQGLLFNLAGEIIGRKIYEAKQHERNEQNGH